MLGLLRNRRRIPSVTDDIDVSILLLQKSKDDLLLHFSTDQLKNLENITPPFLEKEPVGCSKVFFSSFSSIYSYGMESSYMLGGSPFQTLK